MTARFERHLNEPRSDPIDIQTTDPMNLKPGYYLATCNVTVHAPTLTAPPQDVRMGDRVEISPDGGTITIWFGPLHDRHRGADRDRAMNEHWRATYTIQVDGPVFPTREQAEAWATENVVGDRTLDQIWECTHRG